MALDDYRERMEFRAAMARLADRAASLRQEQEGETDEERRAADYGLTHIPRGTRAPDNVIAVDFATRTRVSGPNRGRTGR